MTRRRAPLAPLSGNIATVSKGQRKGIGLDGIVEKVTKTAGIPAVKWEASLASNKVGITGKGKHPDSSLEPSSSSSRLPSHPRRATASYSVTNAKQQGRNTSRGARKATKIPKPPGLSRPGGKNADVTSVQQLPEKLVATPRSNDTTSLGPRLSSTSQHQSTEKMELAAVDVEGRAGESPQELCGYDIDSAGYSFLPPDPQGVVAPPSVSDSGSSGGVKIATGATKSSGLEPLPEDSNGCGLQGSALRSMLTQYLFSPGSSTGPAEEEPPLPSNAAVAGGTGEEESPFAVLCRKLYASPTSCDGANDEGGGGLVETVAGLTHAESASLELAALSSGLWTECQNETLRHNDGGGGAACSLDSFLAECNPKLRAAIDSPARRTLAEVWRAAGEADALRKQLLQAREETASPAGSWPDSEDSGIDLDRGSQRDIIRVVPVQHEETIRREVTELQARLAALKAASESALAAAGNPSNQVDLPSRKQPQHDVFNTARQHQNTSAGITPSCGKDLATVVAFATDGGDGNSAAPALVGPIPEVMTEETPRCSSVEQPDAASSSVNPLFDDDSSDSNEWASSPDSSPDIVDRGRLASHRRRAWCYRLNAAARESQPATVLSPTRVVAGSFEGSRTSERVSAGSVGRNDDVALAAKRWARARELQRRAQAMGLRV